MKSAWNRTIILAAVTSLAFFWYYAVDVKGSFSPPWSSASVFGLSPEKVDFLSIHTPDGTVECVREKGAWRIVCPEEALGDEKEIAQVVSALAGLKMERNLGRVDDLNEYGVTGDRSVTLGAAGRRVRVAIGSENPGGSYLYASRDMRNVFLVSKWSIEDELGKKFLNLRERRILVNDRAQASAVSISGPRGEVRLQRADGAWGVRSGSWSDRADDARVSELLDILAENAVSLEPETGIAPEKKALSISVDEGKERAVLTLGGSLPSGRRAWSSLKPGLRLIVPERLYEIASSPPDWWRSRRLFASSASDIVELRQRREDGSSWSAVRKGARWIVPQLNRAADRAKVNAHLDRLVSVRAETVVAADPQTAQQASSWPAEVTVVTSVGSEKILFSVPQEGVRMAYAPGRGVVLTVIGVEDLLAANADMFLPERKTAPAAKGTGATHRAPAQRR